MFDRLSLLEQSERVRLALGCPWFSGSSQFTRTSFGPGFLVLSPASHATFDVRTVDARGRISLTRHDRSLLGGPGVLVAHLEGPPVLLLGSGRLLTDREGHERLLAGLEALS